MEVRHSKPSQTTADAKTKRALVFKLWQEMGEPAVGATVLARIQQQLSRRLGDDAVASPAKVARILADAGAELRHPEVIEFDAEWRQARASNETNKFSGLEDLILAKPITLGQAEELINKLELLRQKFELAGDQTGLAELRQLAAGARQTAQLQAKSYSADDAPRAEQIEMAEWLKVWLQTPHLFKDWLELRRRTDEFRQRFGAKTT